MVTSREWPSAGSPRKKGLPSFIFFAVLGSLQLLIDTVPPASCLEPRDVVFVVMSQGDSYNAGQAHNLKDDILLQAQKFQQPSPVVHLFHEDFPHPGAWTILPIITKLYTLHGVNSSWVLFLESRTRVNLPVLLSELAELGAEGAEPEASRSKQGKKAKGKGERGKWVGHALRDREPTIIHHFQSDGRLSYPHFSAGFAIDRVLLHILSDRVEEWAASGEVSDFSIDAAHELASFIWNSGQGAHLTHSKAFCLTLDQNKTESHARCATWPLRFEPCGEPESPDAVYFAVKTCSKFHKARLPVVKRTWAQYAVHITYFSDTEDPSIPSVNLGIPNTEHGHCAKTKGILQHVSKEIKSERLKNIKWAVLVDDDTILSVARLLSLLSCFQREDKKPVVLGERYGYRVSEPMEEEFPSYSYGYNYATGGGGVVLNVEAIHTLSESDVCVCPSPDAPDDMVLLGVCLSRLGISVTHSPSFHQARPLDYPAKFLKPQHPVSFHKHWMIDPVNVYQEWFAASDQEIKLDKASIHNEL
ncbi:beta-1,3-glucosyltransferase [Ischnura elegans]|uniref:beta-1,3-glucosyltransferase n=1 Tax=Ischnura elegans TaxID=197161 RepID=UPI001ED885A4|nr:beta-1,3-glucosyltransferase [Ischnura elegans]XP_046390660.1 beta-1,3-glucosyltransferase [Ischnura elegans]